MKTFTIGICYIGSGTGSSVINSCRLSGLPIRTIGFGTNPFAFGIYDCDAFDYTPNIYLPEYVDMLIEKCFKHNVDLLIPGSDDEALIFSKSLEKFKAAGIKVIVSEEPLLRICRDKERMSTELNKVEDVFVKSYGRDEFLNLMETSQIQFPFIAKPRAGYGSRGIEIINPREDAAKITDGHIVQELAIPHSNDPNRETYMNLLNKNINPQLSEVSIQLVTDKNGELIGRVSTYNKLHDGVPIEILPFETPEVWKAVDKLYPKFKELGLRGPLNLQGRLTDAGLKIFELNARFTGITGLRALMGFNEVEACIKSWLDLDDPKTGLKMHSGKFGIRQTADRAVSLKRNDKVEALYTGLNKVELKSQPTVLITGATKGVGKKLISKLIEEEKFEIWTLTPNKKKAKGILLEKRIQFYDKADFLSGNLSLGNVDVIVHCGFAKSSASNSEIAESLEFAAELFTRAAMTQVPAIINISSLSIFGKATANNTLKICPSSPFAEAKFALEVLLSALRKINHQLISTSIRVEQEENADNVENIVSVISDLLKKSPQGWSNSYNLFVRKRSNQLRHVSAPVSNEASSL